jgi:hypothetical protein
MAAIKKIITSGVPSATINPSAITGTISPIDPVSGDIDRATTPVYYIGILPII